MSKSDEIWMYQLRVSTRCPDRVALVLASSALYGESVRLFYGDGKTGQDWMEESITRPSTIKVGLSGEPVAYPLRSKWGDSILTDRIVKIVRMSDGRVLYQHPKYKAPVLVLDWPPRRIGNVDLLSDGYVAGVYRCDGGGRDNVANFKSVKAAQRWAAYMMGERMTP